MMGYMMTSHKGQISNYNVIYRKDLYKLITFILKLLGPGTLKIRMKLKEIFIFDKAWFDHICVPHFVYNCKSK